MVEYDLLVMIQNLKIYIAILLAALVSVLVCQSNDQTECPQKPADEKAKWSKYSKTDENWQKLSPEEKYRKMKEWRLKMEQGLANLRNKQSEGTITPEELKRLQKMEQMLKKLDERLSAVTNTIKNTTTTEKSNLNNKQNDSAENENKK